MCCSFSLPNGLKFIPQANRTYNKNSSKNKGCFYNTGTFHNQYLNDVDASELIKFGGTITNITKGMLFTKNVSNTLSGFVKKLSDWRTEIKFSCPVLVFE